MRVTTSRQRREDSSTLALSTEVTLRRRSSRQLEGPVRHALHFVLAIDLRIDPTALAILGENAARIAEIDSPRQFAHDDEVGSPHAVGLQRRDSDQRIHHPGGPQVDVKPQTLPDLQQTLLRAALPAARSPIAGRPPRPAIPPGSCCRWRWFQPGEARPSASRAQPPISPVWNLKVGR